MNIVDLLSSVEVIASAPVIFRCLVGLTLSLCAAWMLTLCLHRSSAAVRHRVWSLSVVAGLVMPLVIGMPVVLNLGWLDRSVFRAAASANEPAQLQTVREAPVVTDRAAAPDHSQTDSAEELPGAVDAQPAVHRQHSSEIQATNAELGSEASTKPRSEQRPSLESNAIGGMTHVGGVSVYFVIWMAGALIVVSRITFSIYAARRLLVGAAVVEDEGCLNLAADVAGRFALRRTPRLIQTSRTTSPLCHGWRNPCVILPHAATQWPTERLRSALSHEFAHVARRDVAWQLAASVACALYWFHPLIWIAAWRMRVEREAACDDCVLNAGERPNCYARALLAVAEDLSNDLQAARTSAVVAMVGRTEVERRIRAILSDDRCRRPVGHALGRILFVGTTGLLLIFGAVSPFSPIPSTAATGDEHQSTPSHIGRPRDPRLLSPIRGTVQDRRGRPVAGAQLYLREVGVPGRRPPSDSRPTVNIAKTVADAEGRFAFEDLELSEALVRKSRFRGADSLHYDVIAMSPDHGTVWKHLSPPADDLQMTFHAEGSVRGRLVDDKGSPIANANVRVIQLIEMGQLARRDKKRYRGPQWNSPGFVDLKWSSVPLSARTDETGNFEIHGLPQKYAATLLIEEERSILTELYAATSDKLTPDLTYFHNLELLDPDFTYTLKRGSIVRGRVIAADTRDPIPGATVTGPKVIDRAGRVVVTSLGFGDQSRRAVEADDQGRFVMHGLPTEPHPQLAIAINPQPTSVYLPISKKIEQRELSDEGEVQFELPRGVKIKGRVVNEWNSQAVAGAKINAQSVMGKRQVKLRNGRVVRLVQPGVKLGQATSDDDGRFELAVHAGEVDLRISQSDSGAYRYPDPPSRRYSLVANRRISVRDDEVNEEYEIRMPHRPTFYGRVIDSNGDPVAEAEIAARTVFGRSRGNAWQFRTRTDDQGGFTLSGLLPYSKPKMRNRARQRQRVVRRNAGRGNVQGGAAGARLGKIIGAPAKRPMIEIVAMHHGRMVGSRTAIPMPQSVVKRYRATVRVEPLTATAAGRVVDKMGQPVAGAVVRLQGNAPVTPVATGENGEFRFEHLLPGASYRCLVQADGYLAPNNTAQFFKLLSNHTHQLELEVIKTDQSVAGVVVDADGNPIPGVRVQGQFSGGGVRKKSATVVTDESGRFQLNDLPPGKGYLQARSPAGQIAIQNLVKTGRNDVQIVVEKRRRIDRRGRVINRNGQQLDLKKRALDRQAQEMLDAAKEMQELRKKTRDAIQQKETR